MGKSSPSFSDVLLIIFLKCNDVLRVMSFERYFHPLSNGCKKSKIDRCVFEIFGIKVTGHFLKMQ